MRVNGHGVVMMVIYRATDPDSTAWFPVDAGEVPDWIKHDPDMIHNLSDGLVAHRKGEPYWYLGMKEEQIAQVLQ